MATPELAIAKATLSATLFRADPTSLSRPVVEAFFPLLTNALSQCSRPNVQKCKAWIVDNVAPSAARAAALAKYFGALSKSLQDDGLRPSLKRRRLHVLYVLNDVFYAVVKRKGDRKFATAWNGVLPGLIASASAFDNCPKHKKKLEDLIDLWDEKQYFAPDLVSKLKDAFTSGVASQPTKDAQASNAPIKLAKDAPYTLPSFHGDPSTPWYDLPAATWLPHLTPNSTKPMIPDLIRPIQLAPGPADKVLVHAVQGLLGEVERMFSKEQKGNDEPGLDLNELGERVVLDEITGEVISGETYYGWSRQFCEKMKGRRKNAGGRDRGRSRSRSSSYSRGRSRSSSRHGQKRQRLSRDSRGRSISRSRSPSRHHQSRSYSRDRSRSRRRTHSYSRSRSPSHDKRHDRSRRQRSYSRSRSRSHSPPNRRDYEPHDRSNRPPVPPTQQPFPPPFPNIPPPPADFPIPPPPPGGYQGPWPPPPPPPHMAGAPQGWFPNPAMMSQMMGGWGVPPPPQPPPHNGYQGGGRGNGGFRGRGRGGYGGRGGW